jgi:signal transduction histidine kinase/CheY-like chemotaxis protein
VLKNRRTLLIGIISASLPIFIFASVLIAVNAYNSQSAVEAASLDQARQIINDVDAHISRSTGVLELLSTSSAIRRRDWTAAISRAAEIEALNPEWRTATMLDLTDGSIVFTTSSPSPRASPLSFARALPNDGVGFGGILRRAGRCTCVLIGSRVCQAGENLALVIELDPSSIQKILLAGTPPGAVSAVVDRRGNFLGRTVDYVDRVGTPATVYVRSALHKGAQGYYRGETYEGLVNYTAFVRSPTTGWSAHVAVSSKLIADPQRRFYLAVLIASTLALAIAIAVALILWRNLQARKDAEERLLETQHLESLGRLTGGIAHDFNNMLAIIGGNIELVKRSGGLTPASERQLGAASQGVERAADLTRRMLAYARRQRLRPETLDCRAIMHELSILLERTMGDHIRLDCRAVNCTWPVNADRSELENALVNLVVNARDAMPGGGQITITARDIASGGTVAGRAVALDSVIFEVSDTGHGIPANLIKQVTEPFFTTKAVNGGTGLGLSQVMGFAEQSGGEIRIISQENGGTTVVIVLPRAEPNSIAHKDAVSVETELTPGLRIMVIEDDERVLETTVALLRELGAKPVPFSSPTLAVAALSVGRWDAVITDNQMPEMFGTDVIAKAEELGLGIPILLVSALPISDSAQVPHFLQKPFTSADLVTAIHGLVGSDQNIGLVTVLRRSPISLCYLGFECERADAAQI